MKTFILLNKRPELYLMLIHSSFTREANFLPSDIEENIVPHPVTISLLKNYLKKSTRSVKQIIRIYIIRLQISIS